MYFHRGKLSPIRTVFVDTMWGPVTFVIFLVYSCVGRDLGVWYCGDDQCAWAITPNLDSARWIIDRGDGKPTASIVILSFLDPLAIVSQITDERTLEGIPKGITSDVVNFFQSRGVNVMFSVGGEAYTDDGRWDQALLQPQILAQNLANIALKFGVGIEIDYESENTQSLSALDTLITTYRRLIPVSNQPHALLSADLGAGTGYLTKVSKWASNWLNSSSLNWVNAMVTGSPYSSAADAEQYWQQHLDGVNWASIPPVDPKQLVVSLYASSQSKNCKSFEGTVLQAVLPWIKTKGTKGIFFWAAGCPSTTCVSNCTGIMQASKVIL